MINSKLFSIMMIFSIAMASPVLAFEMSGSVYRISADMNVAGGSASGAGYKLVESSFGSVVGISKGSSYILNAGVVTPMELTFFLVSPTFNPAEILVHFWRD